MRRGDWTAEYLARGERHGHRVEQAVFADRSAHQVIEVLDTTGYGRGLFLDGRIQHLELDEYVYSESLVHPAALMLGDRCRDVLVVGGGPGGAIREVLKHRSVRSVTQVEIDSRVIEISREYFGHIADGCYEDSRLHLVIADIRDYIRTCDTQYDLIVYDVSEPLPNSPAADLFCDSALQSMRRKTSDAGSFVTWAGSAGPQSNGMALDLIARVQAVFAHTCISLCHTQLYGTAWLSVIGSSLRLCPLALKPQDIDDLIARQVDRRLQMYDGLAHQHMFSLPKDVRAALAGRTDGCVPLAGTVATHKGQTQTSQKDVRSQV